MWFWEGVGELLGPAIWTALLIILVTLVVAMAVTIERWRLARRPLHERLLPSRPLPVPASPLIAELQAMATRELGNRAIKVNQILSFAEPSREGLDTAIDQISALEILFISSERIDALADRMRTRVREDSSERTD